MAYQIIPALYYYDEDQTHDLLIMGRRTGSQNEQAFGAFYSKVGKFFISQTTLIDRYQPRSDIPWCNRWSEKAFYFAKAFSRAEFGSVDSPNTEKLYYLYGEIPLTITVPPKTKAIISWLEINDNDYYRTAIFERCHKEINNVLSDEPLTVTIRQSFALWSIELTNCVTTHDPEQLTLADYNKYIPNLIYANMETGLTNLITSLNINEYVMTGAVHGNPVGYGRIDDKLYRAGLVYANNNPWGAVENLSNLGYMPVCKTYWWGPFTYPIEGNFPPDEPSIFFLEDIPPQYTYETNGYEWYFNLIYPNYYLTALNYPPAVSDPDNDTWLSSIRTTFTLLLEEVTIEEFNLDLSQHNYYLNQHGFMPDSVRIKEIHACLQADKFAYDDTNKDNARIANLGYYIERIARILGISVNSDGSIRSVRQRRVLPATGTIPAGWGLGQWESNEGGTYLGQVGGNAGEERDGICYKQRSNQVETSAFNDEEFELKAGNVVLCENIFQVLESYLEDLDKGLNWQEMGGGVIPSPSRDGKFCTFEGMGSLLAENAFMLGALSRNTSQTFISSIVTQAIVQEILRALGCPLEVHYIPCETGFPGDNDPDPDKSYRTKIPYPAVADDSPSVLQQTLWLLQNMAQIKGALAKPKD